MKNTGDGFHFAIREAEKSKFIRNHRTLIRLGAVVLKKNRLIGKGFNQRKTHPYLKKLFGEKCCLHAEYSALLNTNKTQGDTIVVVRILPNGVLSCSKPCECCIELIKEFNIRKVVYIDWDGLPKELRL